MNENESGRIGGEKMNVSVENKNSEIPRITIIPLNSVDVAPSIEIVEKSKERVRVAPFTRIAKNLNT